MNLMEIHMEQRVRLIIRSQSQSVIDTISHDLESMWSTPHPSEKIDSVRLSIPPSTDKAIDVVLKLAMVKSKISPRLTLSEGYRNSLGLCIFLDMAKQVSDKERPDVLGRRSSEFGPQPWSEE